MDDAAAELRSIERLRRPAQGDAIEPDLDEFTRDLEFRIERDPVEEPAPATPATARMSWRPKRFALGQGRSDAEPSRLPIVPPSTLVDHPVKPHSQIQTNRAAINSVRVVRRVGLIFLIGGVLALGIVTVMRFIQKPVSQPSIQTAPAKSDTTTEDAQWQRAVQEWHCTLAQYNARQSAGTNATKETSCANQP